jgi:hypothetical protein
MRTIRYALADVQLSRLVLTLVLCTILVGVAASSAFGPLHVPTLFDLLGHSEAAHVSTHLLADGNPPPIVGCGGGVGTHC